MEDLWQRQLAFDELITTVLARFVSATGSEVDLHLQTILGEIGQFMGVDYAIVIETSAGPDQVEHNS